MSVAQTAELIANLTLHNGLSGPAAEAEASMTGLNSSANRMTSGARSAEGALTRTGVASNGLGKALGHAKGAIGNLLTGPLGMIGLGAGLFSVGALMKSGVDKATDLAKSVGKLTAITHESVGVASMQLAVLEKYGVDGAAAIKIFGFLEKSVGMNAETTKKATAFEKQYGFALVDNKGHVKDAQTLLLQFADYYNRNSSASETAVVAAKLFGKSYQQMIPIFKLGSAGIRDAEYAAKALGLTLTGQNAKELKDWLANQRELGDAMAGLKLQIGLAVIPALSQLAKGATQFLEHGGSKTIADGFRNAVGVVMQFGRAIGAVAPFFGMLAKAWGAIPEPLRNLMIGGVIAGKASSMLFGVNPIGALLGKAGGGIGGLFGGRGGSPANPMFVSQVGGGLPGAGGAGGGGWSPLGIAAAVGGGLLIAAQFKGAFLDPGAQKQTDAIGAAVGKQIKTDTRRADLQKSLDGLNQGIRDLSNVAGPLSGLLYGGQIAALTAQRDQVAAALARLPTSNPRNQQAKDDLKTAVHEGNRDVASRTDVRDMKVAVTARERDEGQAVRSIIQQTIGQVVAGQSIGFASVVAAVQGIAGAIAGLPAYLGSADQQGRGTGAGGRKTPPAHTPRVGIEKNRQTVVIESHSTPRSNDYAQSVQGRYGSTPARAGAS